jgi:hypothetical protein
MEKSQKMRRKEEKLRLAMITASNGTHFATNQQIIAHRQAGL